MATDEIANLKAQLKIKDDDNGNKILERLAHLQIGEKTGKKVASQLSKLDKKDDVFVFRILQQLARYPPKDWKYRTPKDLASALTELKTSAFVAVKFILRNLARLNVKDKSNVTKIRVQMLKLDIHSKSSVVKFLQQLDTLKKKDDPIDENGITLENKVIQVQQSKNDVHKILEHLISKLKEMEKNNFKTVYEIFFKMKEMEKDDIYVNEICTQLNEMTKVKYVDDICKQMEHPITENYVNVNVDEILNLVQEMKKINTKRVYTISLDMMQLAASHEEHEKLMYEHLDRVMQLMKNIDTAIDTSSEILKEISHTVDGLVDGFVDDILDKLAHLDRKEDIFAIKIFKKLMDQLKVYEDKAESSTSADYLQELQQDHKDALRLLGHFAICFRLGYGQYGSMNLGNGGSQYTLVRKYILYLRQRKSQPTLRQRLAEPFKDLPEYGSLNTSGPGGQGPSKKTFNKCLVGVRDTIQQLSGVIMLYHRQLSKK